MNRKLLHWDCENYIFPKKDEKRWGLYLATEKTIGWYTDLARAKSEAVDKIYGLFKQNIKSCNAKRRRQRQRMVKNNNRSNQQKNNFALAAHFFCTFLCHCFAWLQCETSRNFLVTRFMEEMSYVFSFTFFFTAAHFHLALVATSISRFVTAVTKFSCCSSNKKCLLCFWSNRGELSEVKHKILPPVYAQT